MIEAIAALDRAAGALAGTAGIVLLGPDGDTLYERDADAVFPAASVIKIPLLMTVYADAADGRLSLDERLAIGARVPGSGVLRHLPDATDLSVRDHATLMTIVSDNTATNRLIERIGLDRVRLRLGEWGCTATAFERAMFDTAAAARGQDNVTTPREIAGLLGRLAAGGVRDRATSDAILAVLEETQDRSLICRYLPAGARVAHKTGSLDRVRNDAALVRAERGAIAVGFVADVPDVRLAPPLLGLLGWIAYRAAGGEAEGLPAEWVERA